MAREVVITTWCDPCLDLDDIKTEGKEMPAIAIGNAKPRVIAMCKEHQTDFYDPFVEAVQRLGVTVDHLNTTSPPKRKSHGGSANPDEAETSTGRRVMCPVVDCDINPPHGTGLRSPSSTASHLRNIHAMSLYEAIGADGVLYDVDGTQIETPSVRKREPNVKRVECDVKGCDKGADGGPVVYEWPANRQPLQSMAAHKAKSHGVAGTSKDSTQRRASRAARKNAGQQELADVG